MSTRTQWVVFRMEDTSFVEAPFTVWRFEIAPSGAICPGESWVAESLEAARRQVPPGHACIERSLGDPAHIVEVWV
jgi:hypothetical protein